MAIVIHRTPWTRQPQLPVPTKRKYKAVLWPANFPAPFTVVGSPTAAGISGGLGWKYGSGNYHESASLVLRGSGAGGETQYNSVEHITFVCTSNAATDAIASNGSTATDGGPRWLLQNNAGTLRWLDGSSYHNLVSTVLGSVYTFTLTYSDISPYPRKVYLNGILQVTVNAYQSGTFTSYVGTGFPAQFTNGQILQYVLDQPGNWTDAEILDYAINPFGIFQPLPRRIWVPSTAAAPPASLIFRPRPAVMMPHLAM